jgi:cobalt-zinc-cadmium efflux system outer membrane protein
MHFIFGGIIMRFIVIAAFLLIIASPALAEKFLSMEEAERLCIERNLAIKAKKAEIAKTDAEIISAKIIQNPSLRYSVDSLKNGEKESEVTYSVSQNIDITGKRSIRIDAAKKSKEASLYFFEYEVAAVILHLKQTHYKILFLKENERLLTALLAMFEEVKSKTEERFKAGDVSEADLMKISSEQKSIGRNLEALRIELRTEKKKLGLFLNLGMNDLEPIGEFVYKPLMHDMNIAPESVLSLRYDVRGQSMLVEAATASLSFARRNSFPSFDIEAGYKKRTGGFEGFVFGVTIPLPIFDRNQGDIERAKRAIEQEIAALELVKKNAIYEVAILQEKIVSLSKIISDASQQLDTTLQLTKIARIAYEEGETGILELLDAVRSEKALTMEYNSTLYDYWTAVFELEKAAGKRLFDFNRGGAK